MTTAKAEVRRRLRRSRLQMTDGERTLNSLDVVERLKQAMDWSAVRTLHYFEPIRELLEVDIRDFISHLEDTYPDLQMCTSRLIGDTWQLVSVRGTSPPEKFDVIIVPMLGFDPQTLHRIGYGGGYYDKFLATQLQARKIGVCYESGKAAKLPTEPHDIPLDLIITEKHLTS